ncbi:MAG: hypothetical protein QOG51_1782 [Verrucomicrobiota bacterium]|jgi:hypothetical protein
MKTFVSLIPVLFLSCASPVLESGAPVLPISPTVTKEVALQTALKEVRKRKLELPAEYQTKVSASFSYQEAGPTIPVYGVLFYAERHGTRTEMYQVAVNRGNGEVHFFTNLLTLKPAGE